MRKLTGHILLLTLVFTLILVGSGCAATPPSTPVSSETQIGTPTPTPTEPNTQPTQVEGVNVAEKFIKNSATYQFDGLGGSLKLIKAEDNPAGTFKSVIFNFEYQTGHPGHGDRSGQMLAQVVTTHAAVVLVNIEKGEVVSAICDNTWDMIAGQDLPVTVSGIVISGGDTTQPGGPLDVPRTFVYKIQKEDGSLVNVSYTAYPPSPAGDAARARITLDFHGGMVNIGEQMEAYGTLDKGTNTVMVVNQGDYIRTSVPKMEVRKP